MRWVPDDTGYLFAARSVREGLASWRALAVVIDLAAQGRESPMAAMRRSVGLDLLDPQALEAAGIDLARSAVLFGQRGMPTLILPVADADRLSAVLDATRQKVGGEPWEHRGYRGHAAALGDGQTLSWVTLDDWLALHLDGRADAGTAWLDAVVEASSGGGLGASDELATVVDRAAGAWFMGQGDAAKPTEVPVFGWLRSERFAAAVADLTPPAAVPCLNEVASAVPSVVLAGDGRDRVDVNADLASGLAEQISSHLSEPAPPGLVAYGEKVGGLLQWRAEPEWLTSVIRGSACGQLFPVPDLRAQLGASPPTGLAVAVRRIEMNSMDGEGAVHLSLRDRRLVDRLLGRIPMRSLLESSHRIAGQKVTELSVPGLIAVFYRRTDKLFTLASSRRIMAEVLAAGPEASQTADGELVAAALLRPGEIRGLVDLLEVIASSAGHGRRSRDVARAWMDSLATYRLVDARLLVQGDDLRLRATAEPRE